MNLGQSATTGTTTSGTVTAATTSTSYGYFIIGKNSHTPTVNAGTNTTVCDGVTTATIGGSPTASGGLSPYTYTWSPSTGLSSATVANPIASPTINTTYTVSVRDNDNAPVATGTVTVKVNTKCVLTINGNGTHRTNITCNDVPTK